jgi:osmotically-inducible protein OsmY
MAVSRTDLEVRCDVSDALASDIRVDAQHLDVQVAAGIVHLRGSVPSYYEKRIATEITNRIKGVADVVNELRVSPLAPRADQEILADVRAALRRDVWVDEGKIDVNVTVGAVRLGGTVESYTEKSYAETDAWSVPGVTEVLNEVNIRPAEIRRDDEVAAQVRGDLQRNIRIDPAQIQVDVSGGVVTLRGTVLTVEQKWLADEVAWWTAGVRDVVNDLRVGSVAA